MAINPSSIIATVKSLVESSGKIILPLQSLANEYNCPPELPFIQTECASIRASLCSIFGVLSLNGDVLDPLLHPGSQLARAFDVTLTTLVISLSYLETEAHRIFEAHPASVISSQPQEDIMRLILQDMRGGHTAVDAIHSAIQLDSPERIIEVLSQNQVIFERVRHHLRSACQVPSSSNLHSTDTISIFGDRSFSVGILNSLVYNRVQHQLKAHRECSVGNRISFDNGTSEYRSGLKTGLRNGSPSADTPPVQHLTQRERPYSERGGQHSERENSNWGLENATMPMPNSSAAITRHPRDSSFNPWNQMQISSYQQLSTAKPVHEEPRSASPVESYFPLNITDSNVSSLGKFSESSNFAQLVYDDGKEVVPAEMLPDLPAMMSPGMSAPEVSDSLLPTTSTIPSSDTALRRHTFALGRPSIEQSSSMSIAPLRRESTINFNSGEGVWMHWFEDKADRFGDVELLAPLTELYLTIPIIGDSAVQKRAAVQRWLGAKSTSPLKFKKNDIVIDGMADDGEAELPLKVTFVVVEKKKNIVSIQHIFVGEAVYAVCMFNIADAKTLENILHEWVPLIRRSNPNLKIILLGMGPGGGSIRPHQKSESVEDLERMSSEENPLNEKKTSSHVSFVSRNRGFAAAKSIGASAYFECSELSCGDLDRMISALIGIGAAARMEYMQYETNQPALGKSFSHRGSIASAGNMSL